MDEIIYKVIELAILVIAFLIGKYAIPFFKLKMNSQEVLLMTEWAEKFVKYAEVLVSGKGLGSIKNAKVTEWLSARAKQYGINLTQEEIQSLLEEAVNKMNEEANNNG